MKEYQPSSVQCTAYGGSPPPQLQVYLDRKNITNLFRESSLETTFSAGSEPWRKLLHVTRIHSPNVEVAFENDGNYLRCAAISHNGQSVEAGAYINVYCGCLLFQNIFKIFLLFILLCVPIASTSSVLLKLTSKITRLKFGLATVAKPTRVILPNNPSVNFYKRLSNNFINKYDVIIVVFFFFLHTDAPRISCHSSEARLHDVDIPLLCHVTAKPPVTVLKIVFDNNNNNNNNDINDINNNNNNNNDDEVILPLDDPLTFLSPHMYSLITKVFIPMNL